MNFSMHCFGSVEVSQHCGIIKGVFMQLTMNEDIGHIHIYIYI